MTSQPCNGKSFVQTQKKVWTSQWSVILRTFSICKFFLCYIVLFSFETSATGSPGNYLYICNLFLISYIYMSGWFSHAQAMLTAYFTRTTIATVLLFAGIRWLARRVAETKQLPWCPFHPLPIPNVLFLLISIKIPAKDFLRQDHVHYRLDPECCGIECNSGCSLIGT